MTQEVPPTKVGYVASIREAVAGSEQRIAAGFVGGSTTWRDMLALAARLAGGLRAHGVGEGDRVAILAGNCDLYMALYLAIPWAGAVITPLNNRWSVAENAYAMADSTPKVLFADAALIGANGPLFDQSGDGPLLVSLDDVPRDGWLTMSKLLAHEPAEDAGRGGDDLLAIFYTGGTTGRPKGVMLSHDGFVANCMAMRGTGLFPDACRALIVPPLFHLAAVAELTMIMLAAGTAVIAPAFDPAAVLDTLAAEGITDALLVPTMIQMILDAPAFDPAKLRSLRTILYGASPMPEATLDRIMAAAPHVDFVQAYGMTEVSCTATLLGPDYHRSEHRAAGRHRGAGRALSIAEVVIADHEGNALPVGEVGEILVRGRGVMLGYWNQPELTADTLRGGWMHTGDGGRLDEHGILYVVDRIKDMIVSGGENVFSAEVEGVLALHPAVVQVAVIGVPDERWGERVHAIILPRSGAAVTEHDLVAHCRQRIAGYKCPRSIELRTTPLPLSPAGKILKTELRAPHWQGTSRYVA